MELFEAIGKRRSVRRFTQALVPREDLHKMVDAARLAPSGCNRQRWRFIVLDQKESIEWFADKGSMGWVAQSPALVLFTLDPSTEYWREDGSAAIENFMLAATALGYGTCWVQGQLLPDEDNVKERFGIPADWRVLAVVPVGKTEQWPMAKGKKALHEVLSFDRF